MLRSWIRSAALLAVVALLAAGCGGNNSSSGGSSGSGSSTEIKVFAAASLTAAFNKIGQDYTAANPNAKVTFNFAGSQALATQIQQSAPADVFAASTPAGRWTPSTSPSSRSRWRTTSRRW